MSFTIVTLYGQTLPVADVNRVVEKFLANFLLSIDVIEDDSTDQHLIDLETTIFQTAGTSAADVTVRSTVTTTVQLDDNDSVAAAIAYDYSADTAARMAQLLGEYIRSHAHEMEMGLSALGAVLDSSSWTLRSTSDGTKLAVLTEEGASSRDPTLSPPVTETTSSPPFLQQPGAIALLVVGCVVLCMLTAPMAARCPRSRYPSSSEGSDGSSDESEENDLLG